MVKIIFEKVLLFGHNMRTCALMCVCSLWGILPTKNKNVTKIKCYRKQSQKKITTCKNNIVFCFVCNFFRKVSFNKLFFSNYKFQFLTYGIISQKLKMSETTKDTEMEPCMTRKSFLKKSSTTFF